MGCSVGEPQMYSTCSGFCSSCTQSQLLWCCWCRWDVPFRLFSSDLILFSIYPSILFFFYSLFRAVSQGAPAVVRWGVVHPGQFASPYSFPLTLIILFFFFFTIYSVLYSVLFFCQWLNCFLMRVWSGAALADFNLVETAYLLTQNLADVMRTCSDCMYFFEIA